MILISLDPNFHLHRRTGAHGGHEKRSNPHCTQRMLDIHLNSGELKLDFHDHTRYKIERGIYIYLNVQEVQGTFRREIVECSIGVRYIQCRFLCPPQAGEVPHRFILQLKAMSSVRLQIKLYFHPITGSSRTGRICSVSRSVDIHEVMMEIALQSPM